MGTLSTPRMTKSKTVVLCNTDHDGFAFHFPRIEYKGESKSERRNTYMTFPSYRENIVFIEHFHDVAAVSPSRLSFVYLRGTDNGEVKNYDFRQYENVTTVDISDEDFSTVNSIFHIVSQLPKCRELRIFLSDKNIRPYRDEAALLDRITKASNQLQYLSNSIKILKIQQVEDIDRNVWNLPGTRFDCILSYASILFPKLESFVVSGLDAMGKTYDLINWFCNEKPGLPKHNVALKDGKASCQPEQRPGSQQQQQQQSVTNGKNPFVQSGHLSQRNPFQSANNVHHNKVPPRAPPPPRVEPCSTMDPRIVARKRKSETDISIKKDHETTTRDKNSVDVVEVPIPPKAPPPVVNIADDEESEPKKIKLEKCMAEVQLPSPPGSTCSKASTATCSSSILPVAEHNNSLTSIGSSYNDWENSSSSDGEGSPKKAFGTSPVADIISNISVASLKDILANAAVAGPVKSKDKRRTSDSRRRRDLKDLEGVHFDRPRR